MAVVAAVTAVLIVLATLYYVSGRESVFRQQMMQADSLGQVRFRYIDRSDSLSLQQFRGKYLLLDFWAPWSQQAVASHRRLMLMPDRLLDTLQVVAASVQTDSSDAIDYRDRHDYPFTYVEGTRFFQQRNIPGIPSQILFNPRGEVVTTFVGYTESAHYDSLASYIRYE